MPRSLALFALLAALGASTPGHAAAGRGSTKARTHVVYPGQTLGMIAKRYNVSIEAICNANGIRKKDPIRPKQKLVIPARDDEDGSRARQELEKKAETRNDTAEKAKTASPPAKQDKHDKQAKQTKQDEQDKTRQARHSKQKKAADPYVRPPRRRGYIILAGPSGSWRGYAVGKNGRVLGNARDGFERVLASWRTGKKERIHGRLIRMLTKVSDHFGGRPIRVVSGFRPASPTQYTPHSRHNVGRAVDFSIPGVPNEVVRDYCRTLGNVGVGYYPNSTFVHLDVRDVPTYWIDYSGPGQAPRYANAAGKDPAGGS